MPVPATSIAEVIVTMEAIEATLPDADGVKWFNYMYLRVTNAIGDAASAGRFVNAVWVTDLGVVFANLYFAALTAEETGAGTVPRAWQPLFDKRWDSGIARIQYALAGMNAHINRDLPVALVAMAVQGDGYPGRTGFHHQDYQTVNSILEQVEDDVKTELLTGVWHAIDGSLGTLDDVLAMWSVRAARDAAWTNGESLWSLRNLPPLAAAALNILDGTIGALGRGLLIPTQI